LIILKKKKVIEKNIVEKKEKEKSIEELFEENLKLVEKKR